LSASFQNVNERLIAVKSNPLSAPRFKSNAEDLSSAEMPEVIVTQDHDEPRGYIPAPLTIADVEGGELKPIPVKPAKASPSAPQDSEIFQVRFKTLDGKLNLLLPSEKRARREFGQHQGSQEVAQDESAKLIQMFGNSDRSSPQSEDDLRNTLNTEEQGESLVLNWQEILSQLEQRMKGSGHDWKPRTQVYLQAGDRLLDTRQLQELFEALQNYQLLLHCIVTNRRQTAVNAASMGFCVEQGSTFTELLGFNPIPDAPADDPLYIKMTVRSGVEIRHSGSIIVFGDVNAGAELISEGDVIVCGKLKGMAHAGVKGNAQAIVMACHLDATQIRIGSLIARVESPSTYFCPEVAFVSQQGVPAIQIVKALDYSAKVKQ
jgi:septum site-determining protein MinC